MYLFAHILNLTPGKCDPPSHLLSHLSWEGPESMWKFPNKEQLWKPCTYQGFSLCSFFYVS